MLRELAQVVDKYESRGLTEIDFEDAAAALRQRQFLWSDGHGQRKHYDTIVSEEAYFRNLFAAFGDQLVVDLHFGYVGIIPRHAKPTLKRLPTIFLLLLAKLHDVESRKACTEYGRSIPQTDLLLDTYVQLTGRDKPKRQDTLEALRQLEQCGVIHVGVQDEMTCLPIVTVLPTITRVVSEFYLDELERFAQEKGTSKLNDEEDLDNENEKFNTLAQENVK
jgi:hypothetical protein